jgi:hypothetical protein
MLLRQDNGVDCNVRQSTGQDAIYLNLEGEETTTHVSALMIMDQHSAPGGHVTFCAVWRLFGILAFTMKSES